LTIAISEEAGAGVYEFQMSVYSTAEFIDTVPAFTFFTLTALTSCTDNSLVVDLSSIESSYTLATGSGDSIVIPIPLADDTVEDDCGTITVEMVYYRDDVEETGAYITFESDTLTISDTADTLTGEHVFYFYWYLTDHDTIYLEETVTTVTIYDPCYTGNVLSIGDTYV